MGVRKVHQFLSGTPQNITSAICNLRLLNSLSIYEPKVPLKWIEYGVYGDLILVYPNPNPFMY